MGTMVVMSARFSSLCTVNTVLVRYVGALGTSRDTAAKHFHTSMQTIGPTKHLSQAYLLSPLV